MSSANVLFRLKLWSIAHALEKAGNLWLDLSEDERTMADCAEMDTIFDGARHLRSVADNLDE